MSASRRRLRECMVLRNLAYVASTLSLLVPLGCSEDPQAADAEDPGPGPMVVRDYLETLPSWTEFAPPLEPHAPMIVEGVTPVETEETVEDVRTIDPDGNVQPLGDVTYDCTETLYSMASDPQQIVVADPNRDVLYAGALIQGRTHRDGIDIGDIRPLTIVDRAPIRVSIPDVFTPDGANFREVQPNQAEVSQAIGDIIGNATRDDLHAPSSISFDMKTFHSEEQFALEAGMSGRYLGFSASASGSTEQNASTTTVAVQFAQRMFTVAVEPPGSDAASFFTEDFTDEDLQALVDADRIGPDNLPVYVSGVVYGRMMTFALTSTASESEIKAALQASYDTIAGGVDAEVSAQNHSLLQESSIVLTTLGGDAADALSVIRSGNWADYFGEAAPLSTAVPLSYTFKNLGDGSIASVSEAFEYSVKSCQAREAAPGLFDLPEGQGFELGIGTVHQVVVADHDGDGYDDLVFNSRGTDNRIAVLQASEDGVFSEGPTAELEGGAQTPSWSEFVLRAGDVDGDLDDDLVWNRNGACSMESCNVFSIALAGGGTNADGEGFLELAPQGTDDPAWSGGAYDFALADFNGDGTADPVLTSAGVRDANFTHLALAGVGGALHLSNAWQAHSIDSGWGDYQTLVNDFDGDGLADIVWNRAITHNAVHAFFADPDLRDTPPSQVDLGAPFVQQPLLSQSPLDEGWDRYTALHGDITGSPGAELVWVSVDDGIVTVHWATAGADGFTAGPSPSAHDLGLDDAPENVQLRLADVGGNDRADLIVNQLEGNLNRVTVGLSTSNGGFDYAAIPQEVVGDEAWSQFEVLTGNFGGSSKSDLAWVLGSEQTRVYVAIAR